MRHARLGELARASLLGLATSCGGSSDPETDAFQALNSGRFSAAVSYFERALAGVTETNRGTLELVLGKCEALARTDAEQARDLFLATAITHPLALRDYGQIVERLVDVRAFEPALDILEQGEKALPSEPEIARMSAVVLKLRRKEKGPYVVIRCWNSPYL